MAENQTTVTLNIGSQRISMAVFEPSKSGGLVLKAFDSSSLLADPATEAVRMPQTRLAIIELAQKLKIGKAKVRYAVSGQSVFTRFVKLPALDSDNIEQLVTFEAQQQLPFPIETVVWDYELLDGAGGEKEVALVAIKSDALDELNSCVIGAGLTTAEIDVAPMAIFNAFRHSYADVTEPVLLIDVGAKTSNLLYMEGKRFFTRSIPVGGASLTTAIAKEYGINFAEAEGQKVTNGIVTLGGGHTSHLDEAVAALGTVIRNALTRLPTEIARTTNYYRSNHGGNAPRRIILAGGGANLPYAKEFFEEKLGLPVEYFNPMRNVMVGKSVNPEIIQREAHMMGELVGLGLRGIGKSSINIDLVPSSVEAERAAEKRRPILIGAAALLVAGCAGFAVFSKGAASKAEEQLAGLESRKKELETAASPIKRLLAEEASVKSMAAGYVAIKDAQDFWPGVMTNLREHFTSEFTWITDMEPLAYYDPSKPNDPKIENGAPLVKEEIGGAYGESLMAPVKVEAAATPAPAPRPRPGQVVAAPAPAVPMANAIRIRGLWRDNDDKQNVVNKMVKALRASGSPYLRFSIKAADGTETPLKDEQIVKSLVAIADAEEEYAWPFEIVIPLAQPVPSR
ncbi:MAG: type pilus assembly protein PilM [Verrucomicrobiota bacterium]|jgi:type IV pilus assembly protein PilM